MRIAHFQLAVPEHHNTRLPHESTDPFTVYIEPMIGVGIEHDSSISFITENGIKVTLSLSEMKMVTDAMSEII